MRAWRRSVGTSRLRLASPRFESSNVYIVLFSTSSAPSAHDLAAYDTPFAPSPSPKVTHQRQASSPHPAARPCLCHALSRSPHPNLRHSVLFYPHTLSLSYVARPLTLLAILPLPKTPGCVQSTASDPAPALRLFTIDIVTYLHHPSRPSVPPCSALVMHRPSIHPSIHTPSPSYPSHTYIHPS